MLNKNEYINLWESHFNEITNQNLPDFQQYLIRENMLEDYLDIFRGINTRAERANTLNNNWYYEHPFFNGNESILNEKPLIRYVLIGEAAPKVNNDIIKYIYNISLSGGAYITAPLKAFNVNNVNNLNPIERLLALANNGVLLIDLFPFATDYNNLRQNENFTQICIDFFDNINNNYSLMNRINRFRQEGLCIEINIFDDVNTAIIAPPVTSNSIAIHALNNEVNFISLRIGRNIFEIQENNDEENISYWIDNTINPNNLIGLNGITYPLLNDQNGYIERVPYFSCNCYNETRGENPRSLFIKNALGLT